MTLRRTAVVVTLLVAVTAAVYAAGRRSTPLRPGEYEVEGKIFGMPEAEVFTDEYSGPPVVGDYVTHLPNLAVLPPGNRTHDVRMDIVAQQIEIAPGVRYDAWTFGGSVPGPVLHVREGDRVTFTMKNRTGEKVSVTQPEKGGAPFLAQLAETNQQAADETPGVAQIRSDAHLRDRYRDRLRLVSLAQNVADLALHELVDAHGAGGHGEIWLKAIAYRLLGHRQRPPAEKNRRAVLTTNQDSLRATLGPSGSRSTR